MGSFVEVIEDFEVSFFTVMCTRPIKITVHQKNGSKGGLIGFFYPDDDVESETHTWNIRDRLNSRDGYNVDPYPLEGKELTQDPIPALVRWFDYLEAADSEAAAKCLEQKCINFNRRRVYSIFAGNNRFVPRVRRHELLAIRDRFGVNEEDLKDFIQKRRVHTGYSSLEFTELFPKSSVNHPKSEDVDIKKTILKIAEYSGVNFFELLDFLREEKRKAIARLTK